VESVESPVVHTELVTVLLQDKLVYPGRNIARTNVSGTIIRGTLKTPNSQLVTPISIKLQRPDGCD
jgi:hypothetical protein